MEWSNFSMIVVGVYGLYYFVVFLIDLMKSNQQQLAGEDGTELEITGFEKDHQTENVIELSNQEPPKGATNSSNNFFHDSEPSKETYNSLNNFFHDFESSKETDQDSGGILQPVVSYGLNLKELADAAKSDAIHFVKGIY